MRITAAPSDVDFLRLLVGLVKPRALVLVPCHRDQRFAGDGAGERGAKILNVHLCNGGTDENYAVHFLLWVYFPSKFKPHSSIYT